MKISGLINEQLLIESLFARRFLPLLAGLLVPFALYSIFVVAPDERIMGAIQRIFYFHVSSAIAAYFMIAVLFLGSVGYLLTKSRELDMLAKAAASVGFLFCSIVMLTGMIWAQSAWNVWWRWEPRLVSFLVLWFMMFAYLMVRSFSGGHAREKNFAAVMGILAAVHVPIVVFSIKLLAQTQQLHPQVMEQSGLKDGRYVFAFLVSLSAVLVMSVWFLFVRLGALLVYERSVRVQAEYF